MDWVEILTRKEKIIHWERCFSSRLWWRFGTSILLLIFESRGEDVSQNITSSPPSQSTFTSFSILALSFVSSSFPPGPPPVPPAPVESAHPVGPCRASPTAAPITRGSPSVGGPRGGRSPAVRRPRPGVRPRTKRVSASRCETGQGRTAPTSPPSTVTGLLLYPHFPLDFGPGAGGVTPGPGPTGPPLRASPACQPTDVKVRGKSLSVVSAGFLPVRTRLP